MTTPTYAYGVVILPPPGFYRELMAVRERTPLLRTPAPPHITMKSPFLFRQTGAHIVERLEAICESWEPFDVQLCGLGVFRNSILYARVRTCDRLHALHQELVQGLDGFVETLTDGRYDGSGFTPHLTLADRLAPEELPAAKRALIDFPLHRRFQVDRLHLLRGRGRWDVTRSFLLGTA